MRPQRPYGNRTPLSPDAVRRLVAARDGDGMTWDSLALRFGRSQHQVRLAYEKAKRTADAAGRAVTPKGSDDGDREHLSAADYSLPR